jgi:hypothetical protein
MFFPSVEIDIRPRQNLRLILPDAEIISVLPSSGYFLEGVLNWEAHC